MAGYTALQLNEVEDQAPDIGLPSDFQLRMARVPLACEKSGISYMKFAPGWRTPNGHSQRSRKRSSS